jgi:protocatechuate 3,4-dioxygenase beta subunit
VAAAASATAGAGAIEVVDASGDPVAGNVFTSRDQVFFTGGAFDAACSIGSLPDGTYVYQVTDASGETLLSGSPRTFTVSGGVIVSADGASSSGSPTSCGSVVVSLVPFDRAPKGIGNYRLWVMPVADLQPSSCGAGCYFGFLSSFSTTQTFAVKEDSRCRTTHCLSGVVFSDTNQNGTREADEPGLPGVVIAATDGHGISATAVSGPDGSWSICGLPETQYTVTETVPSGYRQTAPFATVQISRYLASVASADGGGFTVTFCNDSFANLTFGNFPLPGSISGTKFNDSNGNGLLDSGEAGVAGVTINLLSGDGATTLASAVTDASGAFSFSNLVAGTYSLGEVLPAGYRQTTPGGNGTFDVSLAPGQSVTDVLFGNQLANGTITGTKFEDVNGNGARDPGEAGLAGVTIVLLNPANISSQTITDASGNFSFANLPPGTYVLSEVVPDGFHQTVPGAPGTMSVTVTAGQTTSVVFGNQANAATGTITGLKFNDANGNASQDPGEGGVAGVTINLFAASGGALVATTTTGADGTFSFADVNPGDYQVSEVVPEGSVQTVPGGSGMVPVTVAAGETASGVLFGNQTAAAATGTISGFIFYDLNKDQVQDQGEKPFAAVTVRLEDLSGNVVSTAVTDANGIFTFTGVPAGDYKVSPVPPPNFFQTFPPKFAPIPVHLEPGGTVSNLVFGLSC